MTKCYTCKKEVEITWFGGACSRECAIKAGFPVWPDFTAGFTGK